MRNERLSREQLAKEADSLARKVLPRGQHEPISERTIRYWTHEGLLPARGGPNRKALYEPELIHRCVFIRRLKLEESLSLEHIRQVLETVDERTIRRVAEGDEPLRIAASVSAEEIKQAHTAGETVIRFPETNRSHRRRVEPRYNGESDRPTKLGSISDDEKAELLARVLEESAGSKVVVEIQRVQYAAAFERGPFRAPAKIDFSIQFSNGSSGTACNIEALRRLPDATLSTGISKALSSATGEKYCVEVASKRYGRRVPGEQGLSSIDVSIWIARDEG